MRRLVTIAACLAVLVLAVTAQALEGKKDYEASLVLTGSDVRSGILYDVAVPPVKWADMGNFWIGKPGGSGGEVAGNSDGEMFILVCGGDATLGAHFRGIVHYDGSNNHHLTQSRWVSSGPSGDRIMRVYVSPVSHGRLSAGHPVFLRDSVTLWGTEVVSIDPATGTETAIHFFEVEGGDKVPTRLAIAGNGVLYALHPADDTIRKLTWNSNTEKYVETTLQTSLDPAYGLNVGPDGYLYTCSADQSSWITADRSKKDIYRLDPVTGAYSLHASIASMNFVFSWTWDPNGKLWVGLRDAKKGQRYITEVVAGETTTSRSAISGSSYDPSTVAAGLEGALFVLEHVDYGLSDSVWKLAPGSGGGGGGKPPKKPKK